MKEAVKPQASPTPSLGSVLNRVWKELPHPPTGEGNRIWRGAKLEEEGEEVLTGMKRAQPSAEKELGVGRAEGL